MMEPRSSKRLRFAVFPLLGATAMGSTVDAKGRASTA
jgi:hypothetical protein